MNLERVLSLLDQLDQIHGIDLGPCAESLRSKLQRLGLPDDLEELFATRWPQTPDLAMVGGLCIDSTGQIISTANRDYFNGHRFCAIGSSVSGDLVCLDLREAGYPVWFTNHELFDFPELPQALMVKFSPSFEHFLEQAIADELPQDYYDAADRFPAE